MYKLLISKDHYLFFVSNYLPSFIVHVYEISFPDCVNYSPLAWLSLWKRVSSVNLISLSTLHMWYLYTIEKGSTLLSGYMIPHAHPNLENLVQRYFKRGGGAQWVARLTCNRSVVSLSPIKDSCCFLEQKLQPHCLVLVGFRNILEHAFTQAKIAQSK